MTVSTASAKDFYLKNCAWLFFCLCLAPICNLINVISTAISVAENENNAVRSILMIRTLQTKYAAKNRGRFAPNFDELVRAENLDEKFTGQNPVVGNYVYTMTVTEATAQKPAFFSITADPLDSENHTRHFYYDSVILIIKVTDENRQATAADPPI